MSDELETKIRELEEELAELRIPELTRYQPCGCQVCVCADVTQCHGCGAKNCEKHKGELIPLGEGRYEASPLQAMKERITELEAENAALTEVTEELESQISSLKHFTGETSWVRREVDRRKEERAVEP